MVSFFKCEISLVAIAVTIVTLSSHEKAFDEDRSSSSKCVTILLSMLLST